jgi:hypothetical protein
VTLLYDELRDAVAGRNAESRVDPSGHRLVAISVRFSSPIPPPILSALSREAAHATVRIPGTLGPIGIDLAPQLITLILDPIDPATLRLDTLLSALAWSGSPLGSQLSAYVIVELCRAAQAMHNTIGADELARVHGEIHAGTALIDPGGHLRLFGTGTPAISSVLLPRLSKRGDLHRLLSPEAARGEPLDPRADVYSLGVLYYELLSGHRYRDHLNPTSIAQAAIEGRPPDLPGALPDPRRDLVHLLARALAPNRDHRFHNARMLADAVVNELAGSRIPLPNGSLLERMVDEFVPAGVERGKTALLHAEHDPTRFEAIMSGIADTISARPAPVSIPIDAPTAPTAPATSDAWSRVLGERIEERAFTEDTTSEPRQRRNELPGEPAPPIEQPKPSLSLPLPPAELPVSGPTKPLSGEHLAALARPQSRKRPPIRPSEDEGKHTPIRIAIGLAAIALVTAIGFGLQKRPTDEPDVWLDAGIASGLPDAGHLAASPPDTGVFESRPLGLLTVLSKPTGASVEVNGGYVGKTPLVMKHEFEPRPYVIRVLADGFEPWEQTAYPDKKMSITMMAELVSK